jgi:hypothetical protein
MVGQQLAGEQNIPGVFQSGRVAAVRKYLDFPADCHLVGLASQHLLLYLFLHSP